MAKYKQAVIDADFFIKMTAKDKTGNIFIKFMNSIERQAVMHEYVYNTEIRSSHNIAKELVKEEKIIVFNYNDYVDKENESDYIDDFCFMYNSMLGNEFDLDSNNIYTYHKEDENLGEIRSLLMARIMKIEYFMSDDNKLKKFVKYSMSTDSRVTVYNIFDMMKYAKKEGCSIKWSEFDMTAYHAFKHNKSKYEYIKKIYTETDSTGESSKEEMLEIVDKESAITIE